MKRCLFVLVLACGCTPAEKPKEDYVAATIAVIDADVAVRRGGPQLPDSLGGRR